MQGVFHFRGLADMIFEASGNPESGKVGAFGVGESTVVRL